MKAVGLLQKDDGSSVITKATRARSHGNGAFQPRLVSRKCKWHTKTKDCFRPTLYWVGLGLGWICCTRGAHYFWHPYWFLCWGGTQYVCGLTWVSLQRHVQYGCGESCKLPNLELIKGGLPIFLLCLLFLPIQVFLTFIYVCIGSRSFSL